MLKSLSNALPAAMHLLILLARLNTLFSLHVWNINLRSMHPTCRSVPPLCSHRSRCAPFFVLVLLLLVLFVFNLLSSMVDFIRFVIITISGLFGHSLLLTRDGQYLRVVTIRTRSLRYQATVKQFFIDDNNYTGVETKYILCTSYVLSLFICFKFRSNFSSHQNCSRLGRSTHGLTTFDTKFIHETL
jgi:hypothetical protein